MTKVIAVVNQKGGVGKTTTSVNLAASLASARRRLLLIDLDPQGNATMGSSVDKHNLHLSAFEVLMGESTLADAALSVAEVGYDLLPSNSDLTGAEVGLLEAQRKESRLREALAPVVEEYDYVLIDCPPSLSMLTVNALVAAKTIMIPMQCEYFALEGLTALLGTVDKIRKAFNPGLTIEGLLRTMYDPRNNLSTQVSDQLIEHFGDAVYRTVIPRNVRLAEAPSHGLPVLLYDRNSSGAAAYLSLAGEILRREEGALAPA